MKPRLREVKSIPEVTELSLAGSHLKLKAALGIREQQTAVHTDGRVGYTGWGEAGLGWIEKKDPLTVHGTSLASHHQFCPLVFCTVRFQSSPTL